MSVARHYRSTANRTRLCDDLQRALGHVANLDLPDWPALVTQVEEACAHLEAALALVDAEACPEEPSARGDSCPRPRHCLPDWTVLLDPRPRPANDDGGGR